MTISNSFIIDSPFFDSLTKPISSRSIIINDNESNSSFQPDEIELFNNLETQKIDELQEIESNISIYSSKFISILNKANDSKDDDVVSKVLNYIINFYTEKDDASSDELINSLLDLNKIDDALPFSSLSRHLKSSNEIIQLQSSYLLTLLIIQPSQLLKDDSIVLEIFQLIDKWFESKSLNHMNFGSQLLVKLLSIKSYRELYWSFQSKFIPKVYDALIKSTDLQLKYNLLLAIWLLTFNDKVAAKLPELYKDIVNNYLILAKDSIKEKIARLAISTLLNFLKIPKNESIVKIFLYERSVDIFTKLNERKWADEDLKNDILEILEILKDAVVNLTTFDEYEIELSKEQFNWSPPHKSEEFWIDNIDHFKQNNYKLFTKLIKILEKDPQSLTAEELKQHQLNQTIICHDLGMIVKHSSETIKFLEKNPNLKYVIMNLMNSPYSDVKYEALKTTQILVSNSFAS